MQTVLKIDIEETCISHLFNNIKLMNYTKMYSSSQIHETLYVKSEYNFGLNKSSKVMKSVTQQLHLFLTLLFISNSLSTEKRITF